MLLNQVIQQALSVPLCSQQLACVLTVENMKKKRTDQNKLFLAQPAPSACITF